MNTKRYRVLIYSLLFLIVILTHVFVYETGIAVATESGSSGSEVSDVVGDDQSDNPDEDSSENGGDEGSSIINALLGVIQNLLELFQNPLTWIRNGITRFIGWLLDDFLKLFQNAFASAFIYTEPFSADSWVKKWWSITLLLTMSICCMALLTSAWRLFSGASKEETTSTVTGQGAFKTILLALGLAFFAFLIVRWGTDVQNNIWQEQLEPIIQATYSSAGVSWDGQLSSVRSDMVLKAMLTGGNMSGIDVTQLDTMGISRVLYDPEADRGSFTMMIIMMLCLIFLAIIAMMHIWILALGLAFSPIYMGIGALKGSNEPIIGIWDLILRSLFLQSLFAAFFMFVSDFRGNGQDTLGGASPDLVTLILFIVLVVIVHSLYVKRIVTAVQSPGDLGGGIIIEKAGNITARAAGGAAGFAEIVGLGGKALGNRGGRLGNMGNDIEKIANWSGERARSMESGAKRMEQWGQTLHKEGIGGVLKQQKSLIKDQIKQRVNESSENISNSIEPIEASFNEANQFLHVYSGDVITKLDQPKVKEIDKLFFDSNKFSRENSLEGYKGFRVYTGIRDQVMDALEQNEDIVPQEACVWNITGDQVWVHPSYAGQAEYILNGVVEDISKIRYWSKGNSYIVLDDDNIPIKVANPPVNGIYMGVWK